MLPGWKRTWPFNYRLGTADEFMLMDIEDGACGWSCARFKHRGSRNYLAVQHQSYTGKSTLSVPVCDNPFFQGTFPEYIGAEVNS